MIPAAFEYYAPATVEEALQLLRELGPEAKLLAGGHSLLPMMKLRLSTPKALVDIGRIPDLRYIREEGNTLAIGATTTHWMIESSEVVRNRVPLLAEAAGRIGDVQVRNMGTIGGSLAHADPAADYPAAILALEAEIVAQGPRGKRSIPAAEFFKGLFTTALEPDELLVEVRIPVPVEKSGAAYLKFPHPASGFAVVGCAALLTLDGGRCQKARVAFTGVTEKAFRDRAVEDALTGKAPDEKTIASASQKAAEGVEPLSDIFASAEYRKHLAKVFARRALMAAASRAH
ncbi:MAG: xanthine dehydrogenase family protein subunit M [Armatimonadota bacterium]|nr:xanthine dehydrogenase family protein subunit M [Armatimonadota bacterium]